MNVSEEVVKELTAMKEIGMRVTDKAFEKARDAAVVNKYYNSGASISEIADLMVELNP